MIKLRNILMEIGDAPEGKAYDSEVLGSRGDIYNPKKTGSGVAYAFSSEGGNKYKLFVNGAKSGGDYVLDVDFTANDEYNPTGENRPLKVMATITKILKGILEGDKNKVIKGIVFDPVEKMSDADFWNPDYKEENNQRSEMYKRFISKAKDGSVEFKDAKDGRVVAKFTDA
jgi:hypothetical protein